MKIPFFLFLPFAILTTSAGVHWNFESDAFALGGTPSVSSHGEKPTLAETTFSPQVWDGGSYSLLSENNKHSLYFKPTEVKSLAPAGGELTFDGSQTELKSASLTIEAFLKVEQPQKMFGLIASKRRKSGCTWSLSLNPSGILCVRFDTQKGASGPGFNHVIPSHVDVGDGEWHHLAMSFDSATRECILYVDYQKCRSATTRGTLVYDDAEFLIGRGLNGWLDELRITDQVLRPEQFLRKTRFFADCQPKGSATAKLMLDLTPTRLQSPVSLDWKKIGTLKPKSVAEVPGEFWSLGCETLDRNLADWDVYKDYLKPLGIKRIRLQGGWNKTEKKKGVYDFAWLDHIVDSAHELGLKVCLETSYGNRLYEPRAGLGPGGALPEGEETLKAWDAWVEAMVRHYQPKGVEEWMMYNEPNLNRKNTIEKVVEFNSRTADVIKRVDPQAKIAGLVVSGLNSSWIEGWMKGLRERNKLQNFTWAIYHGYSGNPDRLNPGMKRMKALVRQYSPTLKLWQGEAGCASEEVQYALSGIDWTECSHAKWNARRMICDFGHEIESTVFTIADLSYNKNFISRYGLLKTKPDNSIIKVKAAYYVVNNIVSVLNGSTKVNPECRFEIETGDQLSKFAFTDKKSGCDLITFWKNDAIPVTTCDLSYATVKVQDLKMDKPVWVDFLNSRIYEIPADSISTEGKITSIKDVPYYDSPILLTDLSILDYVKARQSKKRTARKPRKKTAEKVIPVPMREFKLFGSQKPAPAVILLPTSESETKWAAEMAEWLRNQDVHAFIFTDRKATLKAAVGYIRSQAKQWEVDPHQIGLLGHFANIAEYQQVDANFAISLPTDKKPKPDDNLLLFDKGKDQEKFQPETPAAKALQQWLSLRKTKVF